MTEAKAALTDDQLARALERLDGWSHVSGKLCRDFQFGTFGEALAFLVRVALLAERLDHHPEWSGVYNKVSLALDTHEVGAISALDVDLAAEIDLVASQMIM